MEDIEKKAEEALKKLDEVIKGLEEAQLVQSSRVDNDRRFIPGCGADIPSRVMASVTEPTGGE